MKTRNDFVTNSSSSSYVIAFKDRHSSGSSPSDRIYAMIRPILDNEGSVETECAVYLYDMNALKRYIRKNYFDDSTVQDVIGLPEAEVNRLFDEGNIIAIKEVGYHDGFTHEMLDIMDGADVDFTIIGR